MSDHWQDRAACADEDPGPWDHDTVNGSTAYTVAYAVATCAECPVRAECLADAERNGDEHGIRGGLLPAQRRTRPIHHGTRGGARILSLFSGYLGLDLSVQTVLDAETVAVADIKPASCKLLAYRLPDAPSLGDVTRVDWSEWVGRVDIITGGSPCQDLSHAGKRAGMTDGTRSHLWVAMREAIATIRPRLVLWENVRGAYSACASSDMGRCPRCVDPSHPGRHAPHLRALGRVLGDLSDLGYDAEWHGIRAADVGAPHGRYRVFVLAWPADLAGDTWGLIDRNRRPTGGLGLTGSTGSVSLLPTPRASDSNGGGLHGTGGLDLRTAIDLLPTPAVNDMGEGKTVDAWDAWTDRMRAKHGNGNGHGASLAIEAQRLLPTPVVADARKASWGRYGPAIDRWEAVLGRPAPAPTEWGAKGNPRLSPAFVEWMMGLPAGWITDVPGITRTEALSLCGDGVVPHQGAAALSLMLDRARQAVAS